MKITWKETTKEDPQDVSKTFVVRSLPSPKLILMNYGVIIANSFSTLAGTLFLFLIHHGHSKVGIFFTSWSNSNSFRCGIAFFSLVVMKIIIILQIQRIWRSNVNGEQNVCKVEVMPFLLRISEASTLATNCPESKPRKSNYPMSTAVSSSVSTSSDLNTFEQTKIQIIQSSDVLDVVINEIVLGCKVISCVMFQIKSDNTLTKKQAECQAQNRSRANNMPSLKHQRQTDTNILRKLCISLVPDFSPNKVQMSYIECDQMWAGLMKALGKL